MYITFNKRLINVLCSVGSRMRRHAPFEQIDPNTCVWGGIPDVINPAKFFENRPKGFGAGRPQNLAFPIDFAGRPYNTLTLPCEV